jgi:hypothetical protein
MLAAKDDPYLWAALAAIFAGLAAGQALRNAFARGRADKRKRRAGRWARVSALAAIAVLSATGLLVLPAKSSLLEQALPWTAAAALALGFLAGRWPLAAGIPEAALALGAILLVRTALAGWVPFRGAGPVASLLPFERSDTASGRASYRAELELAERDSIPVAQEVLIDSAAAGLVAESLVLSGPAGLAAKLTRGASRFYRVVAIAVSDGLGPRFSAPPGIFDRIAALGPEDGLEPGAPAAERAALRDLFIRRRATTTLAPLFVLEPVRFGLDAAMAPLVAPAR